MKTTIIISTILFLSIFTMQVQAENWQQVTTFTGSAGQDTPYFFCNYTEWRIAWSYTSDPLYPQYSGIVVYVKDRYGDLVTSIIPGVNSAHSGLSYIHNNQGTFYLSITALYVASYSITIEQDTSSPVPEYSIPVLLLFFVLTAGALVIKNGRSKQREAS